MNSSYPVEERALSTAVAINFNQANSAAGIHLVRDMFANQICRDNSN